MVSVVGKDNSLVRRATCRNCSSVLEYLPIDVQKQNGCDYDGSRYTQEYVMCPCCSVEVVTRET